MYRQIRTLSLSLLLLTLSTHVAAATDLEICQRRLAASGDARLAPWAQLPAALAPLGAATLIVKINLNKVMPPLSQLYELSREKDGLRVPDSLRVIFRGNSLLFVVHGDTAALNGLYARIQNSPVARAASFRVKDARPTHEPLNYPSDSVALAENGGGGTDATEKIIRAKMSGDISFSVFNFEENQMVFFVPRERLAEGLEPRVLREQRIKVQAVAHAPVSWTGWLARRSADFDKKIIINVGSWAAISSEAFKKIYEFERSESLPEADESLTAPLERCFGITCRNQNARSPALEAASDTPEDKELTPAARSRIYQYLKAHRGKVPFASPGGIKATFLELTKQIEDKKVAAKYATAIREIPFGVGEYNSAFVKGAAQRRLMLAWRTFLAATGNPFADKAITAANIERAISLLPAD